MKHLSISRLKDIGQSTFLSKWRSRTSINGRLSTTATFFQFSANSRYLDSCLNLSKTATLDLLSPKWTRFNCFIVLITSWFIWKKKVASQGPPNRRQRNPLYKVIKFKLFCFSIRTHNKGVISWIAETILRVSSINFVNPYLDDHLGNSKIKVTRVGRYREWALLSDRLVKQWRVISYESFRNSLIMHKELKK